MTFMVTGAAGFIGSNLVKHLRERWPNRAVVSFDALTYCGNEHNLTSLRDDPLHTFVQGDITDRDAVRAAFQEHNITGVFHLAAESHVDRSIVDPLSFVHTNVIGTVILLQEATSAWKGKQDVRFLHVSTDEVFGHLGKEGSFEESTAYDPSSPYSASKASSDHFVRAWHRTYGLPVVITNCSNNYGPWQFPEKLIPVVITRAQAGETIPVYGQGLQIRDWLYVEDHCDALAHVFEAGVEGETYCVGGECEYTNIDMVHTILDELDAQEGRDPGTSRALIRFVKDRPGHDFRYAININKIQSSLGWTPSTSLQDGLKRTIAWYLDHQAWCEASKVRKKEFEAIWYKERSEETS